MNLELEYLPRWPRRKDFRIGCIGSGFIIRDCHLVAYRQAGFNPVAIAARDHAKAKAVAELHGLTRCHATIADLLADNSIEVLDIAVPPDVQPGVIREAVQHAGHIRGILAQKPLAMTVPEARECVEQCAKAGITLAVNQNMRYDQSVRALKDVLRRGWLGEPVLGTIDMRAIPHWMPWSEKLHSLSTYVMSIHHLDTFRYWFGTPERVLASTRPDPRTRFPHTDGINLYILEYDNGCRASSWDDVWTGPAREGSESDIGIRWRVEGTDGLARGTIGWPSYPAKTPSTLDFTTKQQPGYWLQPRWSEVWFPDAFAGTMAQLLCAMEEGKEPEISGRDNLETIALCEAVFRAAKEHRVTTVKEFLDV
ncbi:MAG: Gfo/Idh/MocA family oxidoreductase [Planctomycetia bacterium]|nr:Gfo/Idh/MocA family oxidoreductase [Planctomycetia bacterium]